MMVHANRRPPHVCVCVCDVGNEDCADCVCVCVLLYIICFTTNDVYAVGSHTYLFVKYIYFTQNTLARRCAIYCDDGMGFGLGGERDAISRCVSVCSI